MGSGVFLKTLKILFILYAHIHDFEKCEAGEPTAPIGVIFDKATNEVQDAFKFGLEVHTKNITQYSTIEVQAYVDIINTADAFKLARLVCNHLARGVVTMVGAVNPDSFDTLHSYTNTFQMPFLNPSFPEKVLPTTSGLVDHAVGLKPNYHKAVIDTIVYYGWKCIIYLYDSHEGLLRLQQLYQTLQPGNATFYISHVKRVSNASEAITFLRAIEKKNRWSHKHVVLDSTVTLAKQALVAHARDLQLGRRNFHYFLTGLVLDERWERSVMEFGVLNVTGFRMVDISRIKVRELLNHWKALSGQDFISASAALMYDTVQIMLIALTRFQQRKPEAFKTHMTTINNRTKTVECIPGKGEAVIQFEHGEKILKLIKRTDFDDGLTGPIRFNEKGHRINFTMQIVELNADRRFVKVATWSDVRGLVPLAIKLKPLSVPLKFDRNRTYIVTSIMQAPYLMKDSAEVAEQDKYMGLCKDLIEMIAQKLDISYIIRLPIDGQYGDSDPNAFNGWNGMIGDILKRETDMVVAPLQVTPAREKVVDFTRPFLSVDYHSVRKANKRTENMFAFLYPLSKELWISIFLSLLVVSLVLFLVSRFSPLEWRVISTSEEDDSPDNDDQSDKPTVINDFSFWNSIWFSIGSFMQQGSDIFPRSMSGRIVSMVWWFFTMVLVASYTANLASFLTLERMVEPMKRSHSCIDRLPITTQARTGAYNEPNSEKSYVAADSYVKEQSWLSSLLDGNSDISVSDAQNDNTCDVIVTIANQGLKDYAIALPKGSRIRDPINLAIISLEEEGEMDKLITKWFSKPECDIVDQGIHGVELSLNQIAGVFYILLGGLLAAIIVAILDFCRHGRAEAARANVSLRAALKAKSRVPSNVERKHQRPRTPAQESEQEWNGGAYGAYYSPANQIRQEETSLQHFTQV